MNTRKYCLALTLISLLVLTPLPVSAAGGKGVVPAVVGLVRKLGTFIDSMSVKGVDRRYIGAPEKPWQIILKGNVNQTDLSMKSYINVSTFQPDLNGNINWEPHIWTVPSTYVGLWAGYRGYGFGYSRNVGGDKGSYFTIGATGGAYGVNLRLHRFDIDDARIHYYGNVEGFSLDEWQSGKLGSPISVRTLLIDGYYLFNSRRCSYAAAYDQSVIQLRSAGSLIAGAMYYYSHLDYSQPRNAEFIQMMNSTGNVRQWQAGIGAGYIYNFVPCRGLLISAQVMPVIAFYNRIKVTRYDTNVNDFYAQTSALGDQFESGLISEEQYDREYGKVQDQYRVWKTREYSENDNIRFNFDTRLSVTYQFDRFFFNAYGQFSRFTYSEDDHSGSVNDWYVNASIGVRL